MKVLVCGGRGYADAVCVDRVLGRLHATKFIDMIIEGDCPTGADHLAAEWAMANGLPLVKVPPHWKALGKKAGPIRNGWMINLLKPDLVVACAGGSGTADCVRQAKEAGIDVSEIRPDRW